MLQTTTVERRTRHPIKRNKRRVLPSSCWCVTHHSEVNTPTRFQFTHPQGVRHCKCSKIVLRAFLDAFSSKQRNLPSKDRCALLGAFL